MTDVVVRTAAGVGDLRGMAALRWEWKGEGVTPRVPGPRRLHRLSGDVQSVYVTPAARGGGWASARPTSCSTSGSASAS